jgi:methyl-accepting chemotaxis protein
MEAQLRTRDEVRQHVQATNLDIERSVSASTEMAATVAEVARTAADLASVAESLARQVARYKI